jgi:hypothetical protein
MLPVVASFDDPPVEASVSSLPVGSASFSSAPESDPLDPLDVVVPDDAALTPLDAGAPEDAALTPLDAVAPADSPPPVPELLAAPDPPLAPIPVIIGSLFELVEQPPAMGAAEIASHPRAAKRLPNLPVAILALLANPPLQASDPLGVEDDVVVVDIEVEAARVPVIKTETEIRERAD